VLFDYILGGSVQYMSALDDDAVAVLLEFLEAAIHTVLKSRNIYSPSLFDNKKLYGISVSQCRHPGVCSYIGTVLGNLKVSYCCSRLAQLAGGL
jgi:mitotic spindle assembly checkpoint protein MAD2B